MTTRIIENPDLFRDNIRKKLCIFFDKTENKEKHASNLEKGIHNWALKEATNKKVVKKWDNPFFVQIYLDHLRSIYINLKNLNILFLYTEVMGYTLSTLKVIKSKGYNVHLIHWDKKKSHNLLLLQDNYW